MQNGKIANGKLNNGKLANGKLVNVQQRGVRWLDFNQITFGRQ